MIKLHKSGIVIRTKAFNVGSRERPVKKLFPVVRQIKTWCFECKRKIDIENPHFRYTANGKPNIYGVCAECDGRVSLLLQEGKEAEDDPKLYNETDGEGAEGLYDEWTIEDDLQLKRIAEGKANRYRDTLQELGALDALGDDDD